MVIVGEVLRDIQACKDRLAVADLKSTEGINSALMIQGEVQGLNRVIDRLFEIAEGIE